MKITNKDKSMFFCGLLMGFLGGLFGNIWISSYFLLFNPEMRISSLILFLFSTGIILFLFKFILDKLNKAIKVK